MAIVLTRPLTSDAGGFKPVSSGTVVSGDTVLVDSLSTTIIKTVKWIIEIIDQSNSKITSYEILATNCFDTIVSFNKYGMVGDKIKHIPEPVLNGVNIDLMITNNELINIDYKITRLEVR
ncbi:MAG TPA: hypothetical protein ENK70_01600 [Methylophaga sp.]|nr:hypothetical protein [Methylophaga sp.]